MVDDRDDASSDNSPDLASANTVAVSEEMAATAKVESDATKAGPTKKLVGLRLPATDGSPDSSQIRRGLDTKTPADLEDSRYRLGELIGQGGMGEVLLAHDERIGREVAVKRIRSTEPSPDELARFVREALLQGRLEHPAVVPVHDLAVDREGRPFFVMKRLTGTVMSDLLAAMEEPGADHQGMRKRLLRAFVDVCFAIELAHSKGIVHRDLKPGNIMLGDFGEVYVLDWGIARTVRDDEDAPLRPSQEGLALSTGETRAGTILGTPAYMAPEQLAGEPAGPAADIYALGCVLYEIVAGVVLHKHKRTPATALTRVDARPSTVRADTPPELDAICQAATRTDPKERTVSARVLGDAVQAFLDGDRDIAVRKALARGHIEEARAALGRGDDEASRRTAMRAAGHALALDPTASEAADLVTHLMLRPPMETPSEVEETVARIDTEMARQQGRLAALSLIGYLAFIPLLLWTGVRDATLVVAFSLVAIGSGGQVLELTRRERVSSAPIYVNACINAVLIGLVCRMVGPFIVVPTLVATTLMAYAAHPRFGRIGVIALILAAGVFVPWGLELAGVLESTYTFVDGSIILRSPVITFRSVPVQLAFALLLVALLGVVAVLSREMAKRQREASRRVELQAWHLRQLVPSADGR